ncbi:MAG: hypothetical protein WA510_10210 [Acidobacteriaceae bacterium]
MSDPTSVLSDPDWNRDAVRAYFDATDENDEQNLTELKGKLPSNNAYETIYDQTLASYYVHNYFRGRTWLSSRKDFLRALADLETAVVPSDDYFDKKRFATFRLNLIHSLFRAASLGQ